jgi:hypothetical protein
VPRCPVWHYDVVGRHVIEYEHCSPFTPSSLAAALTRAGFADIAVRHAFHGQYLWLEARAGGADGREDQRRLHGWEDRVGRPPTASPGC